MRWALVHNLLREAVDQTLRERPRQKKDRKTLTEEEKRVEGENHAGTSQGEALACVGASEQPEGVEHGRHAETVGSALFLLALVYFVVLTRCLAGYTISKKDQLMIAICWG